MILIDLLLESVEKSLEKTFSRQIPIEPTRDFEDHIKVSLLVFILLIYYLLLR